MNQSYIVVIPCKTYAFSDVTCTRFPGYTYDDAPKKKTTYGWVNSFLDKEQTLKDLEDVLGLVSGTRTPTRGSGDS